MNRPYGIEALSLYHFPSCPFCAETRTVIDQLGLNVELRDIQLQVEHLEELVREGGKPQVPCLRIEQENGRTQWLYESSNIIQMLREYAALLENAA